jgi:predicted nucleic acid-binding protein
VAWARTIAQVSVSVITLEEIHFGLAWKRNPAIRAWFAAFVREHCVVHPVTVEIATTAGLLRGTLASRGMRRTQADMLIAATAQVERLTLATRSVRDFSGCGISLHDPFA